MAGVSPQADLLKHGLKKCTKCNLVRSIDNFKVVNSKRDGPYLRNMCIDCQKELWKPAKPKYDIELKNENKILITAGQKKCKLCGEVKPLGSFYKHDIELGGVCNICISCENITHKERQKKAGVKPRDIELLEIQKENRKLKAYDMKKCNMCLRVLPIVNFYNREDKTTTDSKCHKCRKIYFQKLNIKRKRKNKVNS
jgi:hypothetical protein